MAETSSLTRRPWAPVVASGVVYALLTAVMAHALLAGLSTTIAFDPGDPILNAAILAWNASTVPGTDAWFQFPAFHPTRDTLTFSEHLLGLSVVAAPIQWMTGSPLAAYNATLLLTYPLCGLAMYALAWHLTRSAGAAFLAGLAFAFMPYRAAHQGHIQVLALFWAPLALLGLHAFLDSGRRGWLALYGACWLLQGAANGYFLVYFSVFVGLWVLWFVVARQRWRELAAIAGVTVVAALPLAPILYRFLVVHERYGLSRNFGEIVGFSADIAAPLCAPRELTAWSWLRVACGPEGEFFPGIGLVALCTAGLIAGVLRRRLAGAPDADRREEDSRAARWTGLATRGLAVAGVAFLGIALSVVIAGPWRVDLGVIRASASAPMKPFSTAVALLLAAVLLSRRVRHGVLAGRVATFYGAAALVCWVLAWGPAGRLADAQVLYRAPFSLLMLLPGVDGLRVPARFWAMAAMSLIVVMAFAVATIVAGRSRRFTGAIVALAALVITIDGWSWLSGVPPAPPPPAAGMMRGATVVSLPFGDLRRDSGALYYAVTGGWRTPNGYSGYFPAYYAALEAVSRAEEPQVLEPFRDGDLFVLVEQEAPRLLQMMDAHAGARRVAEGNGWVQYRVARREPSAGRAAAPGAAIPIAALSTSCAESLLPNVTDGDPRTRWECGAQRGDQAVIADLGRAAQVGAVVHRLGPYSLDYPRRLVIETSVDGNTWDAAWEGPTSGMMLDAALKNAGGLAGDFVVPFAAREARYVRLRNTGRDDFYYWSIAGLEVLNPRSGTSAGPTTPPRRPSS